VREALPKDWINGKTIWPHQSDRKILYRRSRRATPASPAARSSSTTYGARPAWRRAFSGKDPTKVESFGRLCPRARRQEHRCCGLATAARCSSPTPSAWRAAVDLYRHPRHRSGAGGKLETAVAEAMDLTPRGIRKHLDLNRPIYARTSSYGHFGRTPGQ